MVGITEYWYDLDESRNRMSFFLASLLQALIYGIVLVPVIMLAMFLPWIGIPAAVVLAIVIIYSTFVLYVQRVRSCGVNGDFQVFMFAAIGYVSLIGGLFLLFWPPKGHSVERVRNSANGVPRWVVILICLIIGMIIGYLI